MGETRVVQVRLEEPLPLRAGDHAVVLSYSPVMLIGGGRVLLSRCRRSRELSAGERALLAALEAGNAVAGVEAWLALQTLPVVAADVAAALDLVSGGADAALKELVARGAVYELAGSGDALYVNAAPARRCDGFTGGDPVSHARGGSQGNGLYARRRCPCCVACR